MPELQIILTAIQDMKDSHNKCMESVREEMRAGLKGSAIQIKAEMEVVNSHLISLDQRVAKQNGDVAALKAESLKREEAVRDFRELEKDISAVKRTLRTKWMLFLLGGVLFVVSVIFIYEMGAFPKLFNWLINKVF